MIRLTRTLAAVLLLGLAAPTAGQERRPLTREAADAAAGFYNRPTTSRLTGPARVAAGTRVDGDLAVLGGPLLVAGTVHGDVLVINGEVRIVAGGRITGTLTVTGGRVAGASAVAGGAVVYADALRFRREGDRITALDPATGSFLSRATPFGRGGFILRADGGYNRVEGLPLTFGPRFELGRTNPTIFSARIIYRTGNGFQFRRDELGHDVRLEQYLGGYRSLYAGVGWYRTTDAIEDRGLSDLENSLSTFVLHRDLRDHYTRVGWSAYLHYDGRTRPIEWRIEYRDEHHESRGSQTPWSLLDNDEDWRFQPHVAEGDIRTLRGWLRWDTRNDREDPATGWLVEAEVEQGLEGDLALRAIPGGPLSTAAAVTRGVNQEFTAARVDVRRYLRLGPRDRIALRALLEGSPDDGALPPQRQHALGGEGSLPAYLPFAFDCGARSGRLLDGLFPYYGCDRAVLFQAEYRLAFLGSGFSVGRRLGLDFEIAATPELVLFGDAGRAWIEPESSEFRDRGAPDFRYDAGIGLRLGRVGVYFATPLPDADGVNFFVRLGPRI